MVWIKSDSELSQSAKFLDFVSRLKVGPRDAFWHLHHLWYWCSHYYRDGVMKDVSDLAIAVSAQWQDDPKVFVDALVLSGFVDRVPGQLVLHDWDQWLSDPVRLSRRRATDKCPTNVRQTSDSVHTSSVVVLSYPVSGTTKTWLLHEDLLKNLQELYPGVDVLLECKKALFWVEKNPTRRKTGRGMPKFLASWMERQQNQGNRNGQQNQGSSNGNSGSPEAKRNVPGKYSHLS